MNSIITIGREFGSGGKEIGEKLANYFGIAFYDKEIISLASKQSGISEEMFYQNDEVQTGSFIYALLMGTYSIGETGLISPDLPLNQKIFLAQFDAIKTAAKNGPCVIVGRCADYVLRGNPNVLNFFITADMKSKIERVSKHYKNPDKDVEEYIKKMDKKRYGYYKNYTDRKWGIASNYDMCVNSGKIGIENSVNLIRDFIEYKEKLLNE